MLCELLNIKHLDSLSYVNNKQHDSCSSGNTKQHYSLCYVNLKQHDTHVVEIMVTLNNMIVYVVIT